MELTLTGASFFSSKPKTKKRASSIKGINNNNNNDEYQSLINNNREVNEDAVGSSLPLGITNKTNNSCHHHHHHHHHVQKKHHPHPCCDHEGGTSRDGLPLLLDNNNNNNKVVSVEAMFLQIKFGTYEAFRRLIIGTTISISTEQDAHYYDEDGHTLAHWAAKRAPDLRFMDLIVSKGFPLHLPSQDNVGMYPIHWAATEGSIPMISLLLEHIHTNCNNNNNNNNSTATTTTTTMKTTPRTTSFDAAATAVESPLFDHTSANNNNKDFTNIEEATSYSSGALSDFEDDDKFTLETKRSKLGLKSLSPVVDAAATTSKQLDPIHACDLSGCTPLLVASQYGHADLAAFLIKRGADCFAVDKNKDSALHWGAYKGEIAVIGLLCHVLSTSISSNTLPLVDAQDAFGQTPIHLAALRGNSDVLEYLLDEVEVKSSSLLHNNNNTNNSHNHSRRSLFRPIIARVFSASRFNRGRELYRLDESSSSHYSVKKLLEMKDNDGRSPLDLATKYKRSSAEVVLKEWYDRYNIHSGGIPLLFQRYCCSLAHHGIMLCSIESWRMWAGLTTSSSTGGTSQTSNTAATSEMGHYQRRMKWPFALVIFSLTVACALYPLRFIPFNSNEAIVMGGSFDAFMHMFTLTNLVLVWITLFLTRTTNPGCIKPKSRKSSSTSRSSSSAQILSDCDDTPLEYKLQSLASKLTYQYDDALEQYAHARPGKSAIIPPLCHTCRIVRPLRSKHCRVQRKCVLLFDHYCPFAATTIGAYNYRYFYSFLLFLSCSEFGFVATWIQYLIRSQKFDLLVFVSGCYLAIFIIPSVGLLVYHTDLILRNLTTNEHQNIWKYSYLQDPISRTYMNLFDEGILGNVYSRFYPNESSYTLRDPQQPTDVAEVVNEALC